MSGGGTMIWSNDGSGYTRASSTGVLDTDKWHQVAIAADGTNVAIYIDGVKSGSGSIADIVTESTNTYLGVNFWDTPFNGLIDDLYIYNGTTLDDSQITALYEVTSK
jgi:arabinan endo-1,5-alpha-L-arabinosidase